MAVGTSDLGVPVLVDKVVVRRVEGDEAYEAGKVVLEDSELLKSAGLVEAIELVDSSPLVDVLELRNPVRDGDEIELDGVGRRLLLSDVLLLLVISIVSVVLELLEPLEESLLEVVVANELPWTVEELLVVVTSPTAPVIWLYDELVSDGVLLDTELVLDVVVADMRIPVVGGDELEVDRLVLDARPDVEVEEVSTVELLGVELVEDTLTTGDVATVPVGTTMVITVEDCWLPCEEVVLGASVVEIVGLRLKEVLEVEVPSLPLGNCEEVEV